VREVKIFCVQMNEVIHIVYCTFMKEGVRVVSEVRKEYVLVIVFSILYVISPHYLYLA
jgi:tRNA splicing endonuclease